MSALAIGFDIVLTAAIVFGMANIGKLLGPKGRHEGDADVPFETGQIPQVRAVEHMSIIYYKFAVLFVVFDVDFAFLLPWALNRRTLDLEQMATMSVFVALAGFMLAYFWRKGTLECR